jgi:hypothetical protein
MEVLQIKNKAQFPNTLKRFHIYDLSRQKLQMNDTFTDIHNPIFDLIIKYTYHNNTHSKTHLPHHTPTPPPPSITQLPPLPQNIT